MKIELPIQALTQNVYYRKFQNRLIISKRGKDYKELVNNYIQSYPKILGKVKLDLVFYFKDKRKRDLDNLHKCLIDSMKNVLFEDDDMIYKIYLEKHIGTGIDKIIINIDSMEDPESNNENTNTVENLNKIENLNINTNTHTIKNEITNTIEL